MDYWSILLLAVIVLLILFFCYFLTNYWLNISIVPKSSEIEILEAVARSIAPEFTGTIEETTGDSRSENKQKIYIQKGLSDDTAILILLHELAHCLIEIESTDHGEEFQKKFLELFDRARQQKFLLELDHVFKELSPKKTRGSKTHKNHRRTIRCRN